MRTTLLACHIPAEVCGKIRAVCMRMQVQLREVKPEEYACTPAQLLSGQIASVLTMSGEIGEGMLVMCGFSQLQMNMLLREARQVPLKAVLTPTNEQWPLSLLYQELCRERAAMMGGSAAHRDTNK